MELLHYADKYEDLHTKNNFKKQYQYQGHSNFYTI